jgi:alkylation response protein AidB-like acyl-CoA dehydrogenase
LYQLTEEEQMFKDSVAKFSKEVVSPLVREMDEKELLDKGLLGQLFEQGLMGMVR